MMNTIENFSGILERAKCLYSLDDIENALDGMSNAIT